MCGILVYKSNSFDKKTFDSFKLSLKDLNSRGPDETKFFKRKNFLLGFTRLSINNIKNGSQPYQSNCGRYFIVFNGEIVNYKDLARDLKLKSIKLEYSHEAEIILNLFILYGEKCVNYLRGFFSFVITDLKSQKIFAAVDRFSIKPLYYSYNESNNSIIITSDFSVILKNGFTSKSLNYDKILDYFSVARDFDNSTIFKNIKKIEASNYLTISSDNKIRKNRYWHPFKLLPKYNKEKLENLVIDEFNKVINLWKIAETELSLCLSTGVDSQIINNFFSQNLIQAKKYNFYESKKKLSDINNLTKIFPNEKKILNLLNEFTKQTFNPYPLAHASSTSLFQIYNKIKNDRFKLTFNGEGSDEIFGGYERYKRQLNLLKNKKISFSEMIVQTYKNEMNNIDIFFQKKISYGYKNELKKRISNIRFKSNKIENKILEFDQIYWIPVIIQRHDFIGMNYSLEVRPPFLDHKFVEIINSLPVKNKFNSSTGKIILKKILKKQFKYIAPKNKIGTPSIFRKILSNKREIDNFKEAIFYGECKNFIDTNKVTKIVRKNYKSRDSIFLWRLYVLNKVLYKF